MELSLFWKGQRMERFPELLWIPKVRDYRGNFFSPSKKTSESNPIFGDVIKIRIREKKNPETEKNKTKLCLWFWTLGLNECINFVNLFWLVSTFIQTFVALKFKWNVHTFLALRILALKHFSRSRSHATFPPWRSQSPIKQPKKWKMRGKPYIRRSIPHPLHTRKKIPISRPLLFTARCIIIENATASCFPISRSSFPPSHSAKKAIKGHMYIARRKATV